MADTPSLSVEHATMVQCAEKLTSGISQDPLVVSSKLLEVGLVPMKLVRSMQLQGRDSYGKASEIVLQVIEQVKNYPEKFEVVMGIFTEFLWLSDPVEAVYKQYEANSLKRNQGEVKKVRVGVEMLPIGVEQETVSSEDTNKLTRLQQEKEELVKEKNRLTQEIHRKNEELTKLIAVLASVQKHETELFTKLETENQTAREREEKLNAKIQLKEREIESLKNRLTLLTVQQNQLHVMEPKTRKGERPLRNQPPPPPGTESQSLNKVFERRSDTCSEESDYSPNTDMENIPSLNSSTLNITSTHSSSQVGNWCRSWKCCACIAVSSSTWYCLLFPLLIISGALLTYRYPSPKTGTTVLGNSDVVLISRFDSSQRNVQIGPTNNFAVSASFYYSPCSMIGPLPLQNYTTQLDVTENLRYEVDEPHLISGSHADYRVAVSDSATVDSCVAYIHVFPDHSNYYQFIASGYVNKASLSKCLSPTQPLSLTLSTDNQDRYYFVGLESLSTATLTVTVNRDTLEYNTLNLTTKVCRFSSSAPQCTIPLHHNTSGEEVCVLATLQDIDVFVTLRYYALPYHKYRQHDVTTKAVLYLGVSGFGLLVCCCCVFWFLDEKLIALWKRHGKWPRRCGTKV